MNNNQAQSPDHLSRDELKIKDSLQHHLNAETDNLDFNVTSKLSAARLRALSQDTSGTSIFSGRWLNWQGLAGTSAALAVALLIGNQLYSPAAVTSVPDTNLTSSNLMEDLPILSASDDIEFYQSIEFLEWMASNSG